MAISFVWAANPYDFAQERFLSFLMMGFAPYCAFENKGADFHGKSIR